VCVCACMRVLCVLIQNKLSRIISAEIPTCHKNKYHIKMHKVKCCVMCGNYTCLVIRKWMFAWHSGRRVKIPCPSRVWGPAWECGGCSHLFLQGRGTVWEESPQHPQCHWCCVWWVFSSISCLVFTLVHTQDIISNYLCPSSFLVIDISLFYTIQLAICCDQNV